MQDDLDANHPELPIQILGMNQWGHEGGNANVSQGRDLPWLQDADTDQDGKSDVWLNSWAFAYRDVVILDADNVPVDTFNLTTYDLSVPANYDALRQKFLDAASSGEGAGRDDVVETFPGVPIDIAVLANDGPASGEWTLASVTAPDAGTAEMVTVEYPADLAPRQETPRPLVISEVRPGEFIELFNTRFTPLDLSGVDHQLVVGPSVRDVKQLGGGLTVAARSYVQLPWPAAFSAGASATAGEILLLRDGANGPDDAGKIEDFAAWGASPAGSRLATAQAAGHWVGDPAPPLQNGSLHRRPSTNGRSAESYETQSPGSGGAALGGTMESVAVIRYTPPAGFEGLVEFQYTAEGTDGSTRAADVSVHVLTEARPLRNRLDPVDVDNDGLRAPRDALLIINALNQGFVGPVPTTLLAPRIGPPFLDTNGNHSVEPADVLQVINALNAAEGEGEAGGRESPSGPVGGTPRLALPSLAVAARDESPPIATPGILLAEGDLAVLPVPTDELPGASRVPPSVAASSETAGLNGENRREESFGDGAGDFAAAVDALLTLGS